MIDSLLAAPEAAQQPPGDLGRNEPCWCGSGKKYKRCHLPGDTEKDRSRSCTLNCGPT